MKVSEGKIL